MDVLVLVNRDRRGANHQVLRLQSGAGGGNKARGTLDVDGQAVFVGDLILELPVNQPSKDELILEQQEHSIRVLLRVEKLVIHGTKPLSGCASHGGCLKSSKIVCIAGNGTG